ncbi:MAG: DUF1559 domain-containing protein [bacterium]|nr:DUF1559 domain-containing protein [bacterium]
MQAAREAARRIQCTNNLKQVGLGLHNHHDTRGDLPPIWTTNSSKRYSWMVHLFPYLEQTNLYDAIDPTGAAIYTTTATTGGAVIENLVCPSSIINSHNAAGFAKSNYLGNQGWNNNTSNNDYGGAFANTGPINFASVTDGLSNTIFAGEVDGDEDESQNAFPVWIGPSANSSTARRSVVRRFCHGCPINRDCTASGDCNAAIFSSRHPTGALHLFGDGSVHFITETIEMGSNTSATPNGTYGKLMVRNDGGVVGDY